METTSERVDKIKKILAKAGIAAIASVGLLGGEYCINPDIELVSNKYTGYEYDQIRKEIGELGSKDNLTYEQLKVYVEVLNKEKDKCGGKIYPINNKQDIRDQVKKFDKGGCPK